MTSNILAGERRWAYARRTGMTVLGKVSVPKPLNLPSQRLENHGLDPNVEIVPKGTLGWGSRPSSASNPWGSPTQSVTADGSASSPSQLSGRPSSAGSGSRPSTAGSDRTHERAANAWGPSSRPSSASGVLASNQQSTSLQPHSAETRPNSSQLSRFAEPLPDSSTARGPSGSLERVVAATSENDRFSLSSGDFPTLHSNKESSTKNSEPQDQGCHSRPSSASGTGKTETSQADGYSGTANTWSRDGPQSADDGIHPGIAKWHGENQPYHNANVPPPQFDAWRGPSMNAPAGVWYRGPPPGLPYGAPVGPGGFPIEPFPYYCPQIPPPALANSQPVPRSGPGPRGHHYPKNGELYRPQIPDTFVRPGMPFRPGFYPGPYEGYYGPPMGYGNSYEREVPFKGMAGPPIHNRYSTPNAPDSGHSDARGGRNGSTRKIVSGCVETTHSGDAPSHYKVILKQHSEWEGKEDIENMERMPMFNSSHPRKGGQSRVSTRREWGTEHDSAEEVYFSRTIEGEDPSSRGGNGQGGHDADALKVESFQSVRNLVGDNGQMSRVTTASLPVMPQAPVAMQRGSSVTATSRDLTLLQKIEGLNVKVRGSDGRYDGSQTFESEDQMLRSQAVNSNVNDVMVKTGDVPESFEKVPAISRMGASLNERIPTFSDKMSQPAFAPRRSNDHVHGKSGDAGKGKVHSPDNNGWQKKPVAAEPSGTPAENISSSSIHASNVQPAVAAVECPSGNNGGEASSEIYDSSDSQAQRAKMRELAKQRAIQLQKEEEERIREQKAKALAKLEELNRRTQGSNALKSEGVLCVTEQELEVQPPCSESSIAAAKSGALKPTSAPIFDDVTKISVGTIQLGGESVNLAGSSLTERPKAVAWEPVVLDAQLAVKEGIQNADASDFRSVLQTNEGGVSRHKRNSSKPKQNIPQPKSTREHSQSIAATEASKDEAVVASNEVSIVASSEVLPSEESNLPRNPTVVVESSALQRKKSHRSSKKHKMDDASSIPALPSTAPSETILLEACIESESCDAGQSDLDFVSALGVVTAVDGVKSSKQQSFHGEGAQGRLNNYKKPQQSRRFPRNQQANRVTDKFHGNDNVMCAPVRSQIKSEPVTEISQQTMQDSVTSSKGNHQLQSNSKSKRAEMERYVPKPVAKELAQQGNIQQPLLAPIGLSASDEFAERVESGMGNSGSLEPLEPGSSATHNVVSAAERREVDSRVNKQVKAHGAWRQRGLGETMHGGSTSSSSNASKNTRASGSQNQTVKPETLPERVEGISFSDSNASNDHHMYKDAEAASAVITYVRDQVATGKGKRHAVKVNKTMSSDHGHEKNLSTEEVDRNRVQSPESDMRHHEKLTVSKESRGVEERSSSQWQSKSHSSSNNSQRGRSVTGLDATGDIVGVAKKDFRPNVIRDAKDISDQDCSRLDQPVSENKNALEVANVVHQGHRREREIPISKAMSHSPNEDTASADESTYVMSANGHNKQHFSSDTRSRRSQNNHSGASHESRSDWNEQRHRQNSHYEYRPVGSHNGKPENFEYGSHNVGPRYSDRTQSQVRRGRGNFHARQSGCTRVDAGSG